LTKKRRYLYPDQDRHGNRRWYFKPPGSGKVRIREAEGTAEFYETYQRLFQQWLDGDLPANKKAMMRNSVEWVLRQYQQSPDFLNCAENTRSQRTNFYVRFCRIHGHVPANDLTSRDLAQVRDAFGDKTFAARNFLKSMRAAFLWASDPDRALMASNPAASVKLPSGKTTGYKTWRMEHVLQFKNHFPDGHRARIALACLVFTAQSIGDVRLMGRRQVRDGWLEMRRKKTDAIIRLPVLSLLREELGDRYNDMIWWQSELGKPYSEKSASMRFSAYCKTAGLPLGYTAHGVRRFAPTLLADLGFSEDTVMAVLADDSAEAARIYIQDADRARLAKAGMLSFETQVQKVWKSG